MATQWITALIFIVVVELFSIGMSNGYSQSVGIINVIIAIIFCLVGVILAAINKTNKIGQGILIGCGITLLIGIAICSIR